MTPSSSSGPTPPRPQDVPSLCAALVDAGRGEEAREECRRLLELPLAAAEDVLAALNAAIATEDLDWAEEVVADLKGRATTTPAVAVRLDQALGQARRTEERRRIDALTALAEGRSAATGEAAARRIAALVAGRETVPRIATLALDAIEVLGIAAPAAETLEALGLAHAGRPPIVGRCLRSLRQAREQDRHGRVLARMGAVPRRPIHDVLEVRAPHVLPYYDGGGVAAWMPYVMQGLKPNMRTAAFNTDASGYRYTVLADGRRFSPADDPHGLGNALLVGGSTAFGVGASGDGCTLASALSDGAVNYYNLGTRAYVLPQNTISLLFELRTLPPVRKVILLAGWNELASLSRALVYPRRMGAFFSWNQMCQALNPLLVHLDEEDWPDGLKALFSTPQERDGALAVDEMMAVTESMLAFWGMFGRATGATVCYALQPVRGWLDRAPPAEEEDLFAAMAACSPEMAALNEGPLMEAKDWYPDRLAALCAAQGVRFLDTNALLQAAPERDDWLFVDQAHLTDDGHRVLAQLIAAI